MTARKPINVSTAFAGSTPAQRIEGLRAALAEERRAAQAEPAGSYNRHVAEKNMEKLETALERAELNERLRTERIQTLDAEREARMRARQDAEQEALESDLRQKYSRAMPKPVTDAEWAQVREAVLHRHRLQQMDAHDEQIAAMRSSGRYS